MGLYYEIFGENLPAVSIKLNRGESIFTQSGGMTWIDAGIEMDTNVKGGMMKGLGKMLSGESLFIATYTARQDNSEIVIASNFPGAIEAFDLSGGKEIIAQKSAFLCAESGVNVQAHLSKGLGRGLFGGEGFILQKFNGNGIVFVEIDGSLKQRYLQPGESIKVNTGNVAAFESSVDYNIERVKGFTNILFGGEGLFLTTLTGPGNVWLQTMTISGLANRLIPFMPTPSK